MVHAYDSFVPQDVRTELSHGEHNAQKFLLCCGVVLFSRQKRPTGKGDGKMFLIAVLVELHP